ARIELPEARIVPAMASLPVALLNRAGRRGKVTLRTTLGRAVTDSEVALTGEPLQHAGLPVKVASRGRLPLVVSLAETAGATPVFTEQRLVTVPPPLVLSPLL